LRTAFILLAILLIFIACSPNTTVLNGPDSADGELADEPQLPSEPQPSEAPESFSINQSTFSALLTDAIAVLNDAENRRFQENVSTLLADLHDTGNALQSGGSPLDGLSLNSFENLNVAVENYEQYQIEYQCVDGGTLSHTLTNHVGPFFNGLVKFTDCHLAGNRYDGIYEHSSGRRSDRVHIFNELTNQTDADSTEITGTFTDFHAETTDVEKKTWTDAAFEFNKAGQSTKLTSFSWTREGTDSYLPSSLSGFVTTLEGNARGVNLNTYSATLNASFILYSETTKNEPVSVDVDLNFQGNYLTWFNLNGSDAPYPSYPVSDLGSPLTVTDSNNSTTVQIDQIPKDTNAQWRTGRVLITAADGTTITMKPNPTNKSQVIVTLSNSDESYYLSVSDGFQIDCPAMIEGCGNSSN